MNARGKENGTTNSLGETEICRSMASSAALLLPPPPPLLYRMWPNTWSDFKKLNFLKILYGNNTYTIQLNIHLYAYTYMHTTHAYTYINTYMHTYVNGIHIYIHAPRKLHIRTHIYTHINTHALIHTWQKGGRLRLHHTFLPLKDHNWANEKIETSLIFVAKPFNGPLLLP